ncbi:MAG TPA: membrane protein insertase YidC [Lutibacter sp.]|nr:membrane protein insertase YidC [Lutibacter sp.]
MEDKKFDPNSLIGFLLMGLILMWMFYNQSKTAKIEQAKKETEQRIADSIQKVNAPAIKVIDSIPNTTQTDTIAKSNFENHSLALIQSQSKLGAFGYSLGLASAKEHSTTIENEVLKIEIDNKGGQIKEILLKEHKTFDMKPLYLVKDHNANLQIDFSTQDNRVLSTKDMYFEPTLTQNGVSMRLKVAENRFLEFNYSLKPNDYMIDFNIRSQGLQNVLDSSKPIELTWDLKTFHTEKSIKYENQYTTMEYRTDGNEFDDVSSMGKAKTEELESVDWIAFRQQFFTSILNAETPIENMKVRLKNLVDDEEVDTIYTKQFTATIPLITKGGELNYNWNYFYGPSDYNLLATYKGRNLERSVNMGWGIFHWINQYAIIPIFNLLKGSKIAFGLIIILMTIVIRLIMSPLVYKSYLSSAKMKVLRPEMEEINKRLPGKDNAMKRQQETMALQRKAGVSMLSGCIPALLQMPVFFALFRFFPSWFDLRQKSFLWANDLSAYDDVIQLPFHIPVYGSHISLFPLLASIAIFFYMQMSQSQQANMQPPAQEGMPDMQKMMKIMLYISPVMMLFFFNQYGSGLSLYYFVSNVLTLTIMYVIKTWVIDEKKVHAMVEKKKAQAPKKKSAFRQRIDTAMKQAQEQQELKRKGGKK